MLKIFKLHYFNKLKRFQYLSASLVILVIASVGTFLLIGSRAATPYVSTNADQGTLASGATKQACTGANDGNCVMFKGASSGGGGVGASTCTAASNTPGGSDPWGGCFPGANNTGVPTGTKLVTTSPSNALNGSASGNCSTSNNPPSSALPSDNYGWFWDTTNQFIRVDCASAVIDGVFQASNYSVYVEAATTQCKDSNNNPGACSLTVKNSQLGPINDAVGASLLVENSTINGGSQTTEPTVAGQNLTVTDSNLSGGKDEVNCEGNNCSVKDSYLHDNYNSGAGNHQQGFFVQAGTNDDLEHNSINCVGLCTADISILDASDINNVTANKNLLVATTYVSYCLYAGGGSSKGHTDSYIHITNNVFQKGSNGKCGQYGPVAYWDPSPPLSSPPPNPLPAGYGNVWSGNTWDDKTIVGP